MKIPIYFKLLNQNYQEGTFLSNRGYAIEKKHFSEDIIERLKNYLTVKASTTPELAHLEKSFPVFRESSKKLYIPRYFGLQIFGKPKHNKIIPPANRHGVISI